LPYDAVTGRDSGSSSHQELLFEGSYSAPDQFAELTQHWKNRLAPHRQSLFDKYRKAEMSLVGDFQIFPGKLPACGSSLSDNSWSEGGLASLCVFQAYLENAAELHVWKQQPVLVENFEFVQGPDSFPIPSCVRLYRFHDECGEIGGNPLYQSTIDSSFKFFAGFSRWETGLFGAPSTMSEFDVTDYEVQRGAQIMQGVSKNEGELIWNGFDYLSLQEIVRAFRVSIDAKSVRITCGECLHASLKIIDVLIGPFDL
jgi:hypothetical protein